MAKAKKSLLWTEEGYSLFASEGLDGLQVERLSRMLQLNKSGFYHYFGDLEVLRISFENLNYPYLHNMVTEAKQLVTQLTHHQPSHANNLVKH